MEQFAEFLKEYPCLAEKVSGGEYATEFFIPGTVPGQFMERYGGTMFGAGAYRLLPLEAVSKWTKIAEEMFPLHRGKIECFASDWLGRLFAVDTSRLDNGEPQILLLEPGTGEALEIPESFISFHNIELTEYADAALAVEAYQEWCSKHGEMQSLTRCAGYRIPLFLGGEDTVENMEDVDMEVYWSICASLFSQATTLKEGQVISDILDIG